MQRAGLVSQGGFEPWEEGGASVPSAVHRAWHTGGPVPPEEPAGPWPALLELHLAPGCSLSFHSQSQVNVHPRADWAPGLGTDAEPHGGRTPSSGTWGGGLRNNEESSVNTGHCVLPPGGWRFMKNSMIWCVSVRGGHGCRGLWNFVFTRILLTKPHTFLVINLIGVRRKKCLKKKKKHQKNKSPCGFCVRVWEGGEGRKLRSLCARKAGGRLCVCVCVRCRPHT